MNMTTTLKKSYIHYNYKNIDINNNESISYDIFINPQIDENKLYKSIGFVESEKIVSTSKDIVNKIEERISFLKKDGTEDNLNKRNMRLSEKSMRAFFDSVILNKYYSILLDDNGYFSMEMEEKGYLLILLFKDDIHFYVYHPSGINTNGVKLENIFSGISVNIYSNFFKAKVIS